jgi:hypothetical protein
MTKDRAKKTRRNRNVVPPKLRIRAEASNDSS